MKRILNRLAESRDLIPLIVFLTVFTVYFSSSVGLINSGDAPQYFTTEALIQYRTIDMNLFHDDPHYFVWPDYITRMGHVLSFRGFTESFLTIPLHMVAPLIMPFLATNGFPLFIQTHNFTYELAVVSLFTLFSAGAVLVMWKLLTKMTAAPFTSAILSLLFAFGTYAWKYSAYYARQGVVLFISALVLYATWTFLERRGKDWVFAVLSVCWGIAFGLDSIFFLSLSVLLAVLTAINFFYFRDRKTRQFIIRLLPGISIILIIILLDLYWYGNVSPSQYLASTQFDGIPMAKRLSVMVSAPILPTLYLLLFNFGVPLKEAFSHLSALPRNTQIYSSVAYAKRYFFYGMFTVSPFLLFSLLIPFWRLTRKLLAFTLLCFLLFALNIAGNAKFYTFWGGNQYDIRYIYPAAIFLLPPVALSVRYMLSKGILTFFRIYYAALFMTVAAWSLFMGWLGEVSMFAPAVTGERKLWLDVYSFPLVHGYITREAYLNATFMNRENILVPVWITAVLYLLFFVVRIIYNATRNGEQGIPSNPPASKAKKSRRLHRTL